MRKVAQLKKQNEATQAQRGRANDQIKNLKTIDAKTRRCGAREATYTITYRTARCGLLIRKLTPGRIFC
jgi:hypothetical protein